MDLETARRRAIAEGASLEEYLAARPHLSDHDVAHLRDLEAQLQWATGVVPENPHAGITAPRPSGTS